MCFAAVHLISESGDHYNILVNATPESFVAKVKSECLEDLAYISDFYVTAQSEDWEGVFRSKLGGAIAMAQSELEDHY
jgi:hypothetical protein